MFGVRVLLLLALVIGCGGKPHVNIAAPPPNLSIEERAHAFDQLRSVGSGVETVTTCNRGCTTTSTDLLLLKSGHEIRYVEDLLPVLPEGSPAAAAARDVETARHKAKRLRRIGMLMFTGFFVASIVAFANENDPLTYLSLGGALTGFGLFAASGVIYDREIKEKTKFVFDGYDQSLATRFNMCVNGLTVVPCEQNVPGETPVNAEPDPALRSLRQK
jgi:hypothetical protein